MKKFVVLAIVFAALSAVVSPSFAQDKMAGGKMAGDKKMSSKMMAKSGSKMAGKMYECTHCKKTMTEAEAKKMGMKCDCGMKLTPVKTAKKMDKMDGKMTKKS